METTSQPIITEEAMFIYDKQYKELGTISQQQYFYKVKKGIDDLLIDSKYFKTISALITFFKFPILICFKQTYRKLLDNKDLTQKYLTDIKKTAKLAHDIIGPGGHIYELDFLFEKGVDVTYVKDIKINEERRKFIEYIKQLSEQKKKIYDKLADKTIKSQDIEAFEAQNFQRELKFFQENMENYIKSSLSDIQQRFSQIKKQQKLQAKLAEEKLEQLRLSQTLKPTTQPKEVSLEDTLVCCRKFFYLKEVIYQPESMNVVYRNFGNLFDNNYHFEMLKTICGLLNAEGGTLFLGISEDRNTYKKEVEGYTLIEKAKVELRAKIDQLADKCILPSISHDMLKVLYVPLKSRDTDSYISGRYVVKIQVKYGQRKQFYSFKQGIDFKKQYFAIRTDMDTKIITNGQEILNIYKSRVLNTPPQPKPVHEYPCPKPDVGRPLYEAEEFGKGKKWMEDLVK